MFLESASWAAAVDDALNEWVDVTEVHGQVLVDVAIERMAVRESSPVGVPIR
jgi:hypothetical protein